MELNFTVAEANRLQQVACTSHPEEQPGHADCASWYEEELNRRANAYQRLVEALREIVDPTGGWHNLRVDNAKAALALLRELGEDQ